MRDPMRELGPAPMYEPNVNGAGPVIGRLRLLDMPRLLSTDPEPVNWLIEGLVARGTLTLLVGREKEGKSLLALALAATMVQGAATSPGSPAFPVTCSLSTPRTVSARHTGACARWAWASRTLAGSISRRRGCCTAA